MKRYSLLLFGLLFASNVRSQQLDTTRVIYEVSKYIQQEYFDSAGLILSEYVKHAIEKKDYSEALFYQIKYCELVEQNAEYFALNGFTLKNLFNAYSMIMVLQQNVGEDTNSIKTYLELSRAIEEYSPHELPYYTNLIASTLGICTEPEYTDSIFHLQKALDIIKNQPLSDEYIQYYIWFNKCFFSNRFFNFLIADNRKKHILLDDIINWHSNNSNYIHNLDDSNYKRIKTEYVCNYVDILCSIAMNLNLSLEKREAINLYSIAIATLSSSSGDSIVSQKKASIYAKIAEIYLSLGEKSICKEYVDSAILYINTDIVNTDYCDILRSISSLYYIIDDPKKAADIKLKEINYRTQTPSGVSLSDYNAYLLYIVDYEPEIVIKFNQELFKYIPDSTDTVNNIINYYMILGSAYSYLMNDNETYKDSAEICFNQIEKIISDNQEDLHNNGQLNTIKSNLYDRLALFYSIQNLKEKSYIYSKKALECDSFHFERYYKVALKASILHDSIGIKKYLPHFYSELEKEIIKLIPTLGSTKSDDYLAQGNAVIYHLPEWASWNPSDKNSVSIAYDAILLMKGLVLRYNTIIPYIADNPQQKEIKQELDRMKDSIYTINDDNQRILAQYAYGIKEREIINAANNEQILIHWKDIKNHLNNKESCIEFVRYTANAYSWSDGEPKLHYAAIVLSGDKEYPIFIDLFDEDELNDVYALQPKSYEEVTGSILYNKIWRKLDSLITDKEHVYFSPMGMLNLINIELLSDSIGITALEKYNLIRVSSTRQILNYQTSVKALNVVSFGGIDYDNITEVMADNLNTRGNWNYLKNTLSEVRNIEENIKSQGGEVRTLTGSRATEQAFKALDGTDANILHIASHGFYVPMSKWDTIPYYSKSEYTKTIKDELFYSGLVMSGGDKTWTDSVFDADKNDGILTSYEISKVDLHNVELIVLSACETGLGEDLYDGIFGLQRAFKKAGAKSILMSLWNIDDKATSDFMTFFYKHISSGLSNQESYRRTVFEMRKKYQDPYYWASFVLLD